LRPGRGAFLHVATGAVRVDGRELSAGDGLAVENESAIEVEGEQAGEVLLFDLA
jgi:quercetin 2,3-dioxygenase